MPSDLPDHLGYWLRKLSNVVSSSFANRLARHDVSVPQWVVLRILFDAEALSLKDIVARVEVDQGALSRMIDRLLARDLVKRVTDPADRRAVRISLTERGRELVPALAVEADRNDEAFFSCLSPDERARFQQTIHTLLNHQSSDERSPTE